MITEVPVCAPITLPWVSLCGQQHRWGGPQVCSDFRAAEPWPAPHLAAPRLSGTSLLISVWCIPALQISDLVLPRVPQTFVNKAAVHSATLLSCGGSLSLAPRPAKHHFLSPHLQQMRVPS